MGHKICTDFLDMTVLNCSPHSCNRVTDFPEIFTLLQSLSHLPNHDFHIFLGMVGRGVGQGLGVRVSAKSRFTTKTSTFRSLS